jgi:glycosyltransferase involved in cell wall biosynthesis
VATYLPVTAPTSEWAAALRDALDAPPRRLKLPPYREVVAAALVEMQRLAGPAPIVAAARSRIAPSPAAPRALPQRSAGIVVPARPPRAGIARPPAAPIPVRTSTAVARSGGLPRVLVLADVPNWAWAKKAHALKQHLAGRIDVTVAIGSDHATGPLIRSAEHDLYHTFEVVQVGAIPVGYPMVTGITAHVAQAWDQRRGEGTVRAWADRAIGFHANSVMLQREMERYLDRSVYYVPNGVDEKFWHRSRPRADDHLVVGHVARPNPRKGADLVREACARAGVELRTIDKSSKNALSPEQLREWYQGIHVLAVSSDMDGTPNPALEAAACECAIVSNRIGNMPEFIVSGDNGLLTERTVENLADCLAWMKGRPIEYVETMGRSARAHILTDWTWARRAVAYAEMWEKCLGISTRAAA